MTHINATDTEVTALEFEEPADQGGTGRMIVFTFPEGRQAEVSAWINPETGHLHVDIASETNEPVFISLDGHTLTR